MMAYGFYKFLEKIVSNSSSFPKKWKILNFRQLVNLGKIKKGCHAN